MTDLDGKGLKQQMKQADRAGSRLALILGDEEIANGTVTIKDLQAGTQRVVERAVLLEELRV